MRFSVPFSFVAFYIVQALGRLHHPNRVQQQELVSKKSADPDSKHFVQTALAKETFILAQHGNATVVECGEKLWRPNSPTVCPSQCPFLRPSDDKFCWFRCVTSAGCAENNLLVGFADEETHQCTACMVTGCHTCDTSNSHCGKCDAGYNLLSDGTCLSTRRWIWFSVYAALGLVGVFVITYAVSLYRRPIVNAKVLRKAEQHRSYTKNRNRNDEHRMYSLYNTNLMAEFISGVGVMLHFRWQSAMLGWAIIMLFVTGLPALEAAWTGWPNSSSATEMHPGHPKTFEVCSIESGHLSDRVARVESRFLIITIAVYLLSSIGAIVLAIRQRNFFMSEERRMITMNDYALLVSNLPKEKGDVLVEEEYLSFFREAFPGLKIIGVSVVWEKKTKAHVKRLIRKEIHELDKELLEQQIQDGTAPATQRSERGTDSETSAAQQGPCCRMEFVDSFFLGFDCASPCCGERKKQEQQTPVEMLQQLETTGYAFLILENSEDKKEARRLSEKNPIRMKGKTLTIQGTYLTPQTTLWTGYSVGTAEFCWRMVTEFFYLMVLIAFWTLAFYYPYADYIMANRGVRGMTQGLFWPSTLLGLLTVIGNQLVYLLCLMLAERSGFRSKDMRDCFYCTLYLVANVVNILLDMWTIYLLAQGQSYDIIQGKVHGTNQPELDDQMGHPSLRVALYEQLFAYLWPSTMFFSFAFEPVFCGIVPYFLGTWLIRSRKDVHSRAAEECLECPPFDLSRYIDILIIIMLCVMMSYLATIRLWYTFAALVFSLLFVYGWDHYRFLRLSMRTEFDQDTMDQVMQWLMAIPCAMMAVAIVLRAHGAKGQTVSGLDWMHKVELFGVCGMVFLAHLVVHFALLQWLVPHFAKKDIGKRQGETYEVAAAREPCNWFTSNQVHCLRSRYLYKHSPPCTPHVMGKGYLMRKNPELGLYYEQPKVAPEDDIFSDVKELKQGLVEDFRKISRMDSELSSGDLLMQDPVMDSPSATGKSKSKDPVAKDSA